MVAEHVERMQQRSEELNDKLSFGTYFTKQLRNIVVNLGGNIGGAAIGAGLAGAYKPSSLELRPETLAEVEKFGSIGKSIARSPHKWVGGAIGAFIGGNIALLFLGYEHWAKGEAERLAVDEINRDISEAKLRMDPELMRENTTLREMLKAQQVEHATPMHDQPHHKVSAHSVQHEGKHEAAQELTHG